MVGLSPTNVKTDRQIHAEGDDEQRKVSDAGRAFGCRQDNVADKDHQQVTQYKGTSNLPSIGIASLNDKRERANYVYRHLECTRDRSV